MAGKETVPEYIALVRDDRYRSDNGLVLALEHAGHKLRVDCAAVGWIGKLDGVEHELGTVVELAEWLLEAAQVLVPLEEGVPPPDYDYYTEVFTSLDRGMASDLLFWMPDRELAPTVNGVPYDNVIGGAPGTTNDCVEMGGLDWEVDGGVPYGTVCLRRVGSRVFQDDGELGIQEQGFWDGDDEPFHDELARQLGEAGLVPPDDLTDEEEENPTDEEE